MVVRIRLQRHGRIYRPFYRIAVAHSERHVSKKVIDYIGTYDPITDKLGNKHLRLNIPRVKYWIAVGAQPSDTVKRLLSNFKLLPTPPKHKVGEPRAHVEIMRTMQGRGGVDNSVPEEALQPGKQIRAEWIYKPRNLRKIDKLRKKYSEPVRTNSHYPRLAFRLVHGLNKHPQMKVPFVVTPTPATLTAWQKAQQRFAQGANAKPKSESASAEETA
jgi:small subunit ribosomal protein S16